MSCRDDERQRAGPEFVRQSEKWMRGVANQSDRLLDRADENRKSFRFRAAFHAENFFDGREIERICGESVKRIGGHGHDVAALDEVRGQADNR